MIKEIESRRSIRRYKDIPVKKELIEEKGEVSQEILYEVMDNVEDEVCIGDTIYMKCYMY